MHRARGRCKPEFFENLTSSLQDGRTVDGGPEIWDRGLSSSGGGVTLPPSIPHCPPQEQEILSLEEVIASHQISVFGGFKYIQLPPNEVSPSWQLRSASPTDYVGGPPPKLGLRTVTCDGGNAPRVSVTRCRLTQRTKRPALCTQCKGWKEDRK